MSNSNIKINGSTLSFNQRMALNGAMSATVPCRFLGYQESKVLPMGTHHKTKASLVAKGLVCEATVWQGPQALTIHVVTTAGRRWFTQWIIQRKHESQMRANTTKPLTVVERNGERHIVAEIIHQTAKTIIVRTETGYPYGQKFSLRERTGEWVKTDQPTHSRNSKKLINMSR
tara:strand:+ start:619 stop:1137 length:519 start_codon:yes stop_codon:yes gene_type:complete